MRLAAHHIGLNLLKNLWYQKPQEYTLEDLTEARQVLIGLVPSIESQFANSKPGSLQSTLITRRHKALDLAIQAIDTSLKMSL